MDAGIVPILAKSLGSSDKNAQYNGVRGMGNIASDGKSILLSIL